MAQPKSLLEDSASQNALIKKINNTIMLNGDRGAFFQALVLEFKKIFHFDRLCINLYDSSTEILSFFTTAEGSVISALSGLRYAGKQTVAGKVIESKHPIVIRDLPGEFSGLHHPLAEAGLKTTLAYPLITKERILGTLHCSFQDEPADFHQILSFFDNMALQVSLWVDTIVTRERLTRIELAGTVHLDASTGEADHNTPIFESPTMQEVIQQLRRLAPLNIPILFTGETGTGKTMLARYVHELSARKNGSYVKVNCPALVPTLFESELFGHKKGAFTGATDNSIGRIEMARGGTLLLDEIGEIPMELQAKLLHVLEENSFQRVGESRTLSTDFRLIAATNVDIDKAIEDGKLRRDLYYRLATVIIEIPPLRKRREDIPLLAIHLNDQLSQELAIPPISLTKGVLSTLQAHHWVGNIRELRNVVSQLLIANFSHKVDLHYVREFLGLTALHSDTGFPSLREMEKIHIEKALRRTSGSISGINGAAALLGVPRSTLQYRIKKLEIDAQSFGPKGASHK